MADLVTATLLSFGVVFLAELGDKSQLMALTFATRYRPVLVLAGIAAATAVINAVSVGVGHGLGLALPTRLISLGAGLLFLGFAVWTLREHPQDDDVPVRSGTGSVVLTVGSAFLLAELGDKTMLATITLASQNGWAGTWLGATLGMLAAAALAIVVGRHLGKRMPEHIVRYAAAALFAVFGVWLLVDALR
ncbi:MAG: TMEM165/GDT1 family protein [Jiangellaceae bacterium]